MIGTAVRALTGTTRARILSAVVVLLIASTLAATIGQRELLINDATDRVDVQLSSDVHQLRVLAAQSPAAVTDDLDTLFAAYLRQNVPSERSALYTFAGDRPGPASVGRDLPPAVAAVAAGIARRGDRGPATIDTSVGHIRYVRVPLLRQGRTVGSLVAVADLSRARARATHVARNSAIIALVVLLIATAVAYVIAGRVLAPLRRLGTTAAAINETDLSRRLTVEGSEDLAQLAVTFNAMLDRLEAAFESQRSFVSDAGHELRTPITIIRAHLDLLGEDPNERGATLALVADELRRMSRLVEDLLTLAKAEQSGFLQREDIDLDELVEELAAKARGLGPRDWVVDRADPGLLHADRQRLTQAVMNLAANAVAHTSPGDRITLSGTLATDEAVLTVTDTGPGIAPEDQARIFERFERASVASRHDGTGLGLAIVRVIAQAHGGQVTLQSSPSGSTFAIHLPVDPEQNLP